MNTYAHMNMTEAQCIYSTMATQWVDHILDRPLGVYFTRLLSIFLQKTPSVANQSFMWRDVNLCQHTT